MFRSRPKQTHDPIADRLIHFKDRHRGGRAVIVCNGPSLNQMDLEFLSGEIVFGLNKIHLGLRKFGFFPRYLVAVNDKVIAQSAEAYRDLSAVKFLTERALDILPPDPFTYHIRTTGLKERFFPDITKGVREGHTVTHAALQIAYYMGFQEVVIIGMDHRFETQGAPNEAQRLNGPDVNHFSADYFRDQDWDLPNLVESEVSYRAALAAFSADNRRIIDATVGGACEIFPKRDYRQVFNLPSMP